MPRAATDAERDAVRAFLDGVERGLAGRVLGRHTLLATERDGVTFACLASPEAAGLPAVLLDDAHAAGLPIGTLEEDGGATRFYLDLQGAVLLARLTKAQTVRVTEHAARLFLYGRNILGDAVMWSDPKLERGDACIVANGRGEAMGIGVIVGPMQGPREAIRPVHDLGAYLREQDE